MYDTSGGDHGKWQKLGRRNEANKHFQSRHWSFAKRRALILHSAQNDRQSLDRQALGSEGLEHHSCSYHLALDCLEHHLEAFW